MPGPTLEVNTNRPEPIEGKPFSHTALSLRGSGYLARGCCDTIV